MTSIDQDRADASAGMKTRPAIGRAAWMLWMERALVEVVGELERNEVDLLVLKGAAFARWHYEDPTERVYADLDILVAPDRLEAGCACLGRLGFERGPDVAAHEILWTRGVEPPLAVDLHHTLATVSAPSAVVWQRLRCGARTVDVTGGRVAVPGPVGSALLVVLHAAQHESVASKSLDDLERALVVVKPDVWRQAAGLAEELGAEAAFALGLRLTEEGRVLAEQLELTDQKVPRAQRLVWGSAPGAAFSIEWLASARGVRARVAVLGRVLVPPPEYMRDAHPLARRGRLGLLGAYLVRPVILATRIPRGLRVWRRAGRSPGGGRG
jgi:hypothetical protein